MACANQDVKADAAILALHRRHRVGVRAVVIIVGPLLRQAPEHGNVSGEGVRSQQRASSAHGLATLLSQIICRLGLHCNLRVALLRCSIQGLLVLGSPQVRGGAGNLPSTRQSVGRSSHFAGCQEPQAASGQDASPRQPSCRCCRHPWSAASRPPPPSHQSAFDRPGVAGSFSASPPWWQACRPTFIIRLTVCMSCACTYRASVLSRRKVKWTLPPPSPLLVCGDCVHPHFSLHDGATWTSAQLSPPSLRFCGPSFSCRASQVFVCIRQQLLAAHELCLKLANLGLELADLLTQLRGWGEAADAGRAAGAGVRTTLPLPLQLSVPVPPRLPLAFPSPLVPRPMSQRCGSLCQLTHVDLRTRAFSALWCGSYGPTLHHHKGNCTNNELAIV